MRVLIGGETSGVSREAFRARGHDAWSLDLLPSQDNSPYHIIGNFFDHLDGGWDLAIFHPTCTYLTVSAEWAYKDPDFERYPGVGYHQKLKEGTLFGAERRAARDRAVEEFIRLDTCRIPKVAIENPIGAISGRYRKPDQIIQPYQFGDDASKATCLWLKGLPPLEYGERRNGRLIWESHIPTKTVERWGNQTDSGQNALPPSKNRWADRSDTFPGIAQAFAETWG